MMAKKLTALVALAVLLPLTGCWDRRELNELAISLALGIDKIDSGYRVTAQVVLPAEVAAKKGSGGRATPVTVFRSDGITLFEAIRKMTTFSPRKIYAAHLRAAVFGEEFAKEGIGDALDLLSRDYELRTDFFLLVAKGTTAAQTLEILTPLESIPANKIFNATQTSEKAWAPVMSVTLDKFVENAAGNGKNPVLSGIEVIGKANVGGTRSNVNRVSPPALLRISGIAAFRKDRMLGWLDERESKGYNYIENNVRSTVGHLPCSDGDGHIALEIVRSKAKIRGDVKDGRPRLAVELFVEQNVGEVQCRIDLTRPASIAELEEKSERALTDILERTIHAAQQKYKTDIFGFGDAVHRSNPSAWKSMRADWDERFAETDVNVAVEAKIKRTGTVGNPYKERKE